MCRWYASWPPPSVGRWWMAIMYGSVEAEQVVVLADDRQQHRARDRRPRRGPARGSHPTWRSRVRWTSYGQRAKNGTVASQSPPRATTRRPSARSCRLRSHHRQPPVAARCDCAVGGFALEDRRDRRVRVDLAVGVVERDPDRFAPVLERVDVRDLRPCAEDERPVRPDRDQPAASLRRSSRSRAVASCSGV